VTNGIFNFIAQYEHILRCRGPSLLTLILLMGLFVSIANVSEVHAAIFIVEANRAGDTIGFCSTATRTGNPEGESTRPHLSPRRGCQTNTYTIIRLTRFDPKHGDSMYLRNDDSTAHFKNSSKTANRSSECECLCTVAYFGIALTN
jgi:hypothetical protein